MLLINNENFWLVQAKDIFSANTAVTVRDQSLSYSDMYNSTLNAVQFLRELGIKSDENVGILYTHQYDFFIIVNALWIIGAVPVPLNTRNKCSEIEWQISHAEIKHLLLDRELLSNYASLEFGFDLISDLDLYSPLTESFNPHLPFSPARRALIMFTSGSSGNPKAVVHTFQSLFASVEAIDFSIGLNPDNIWIASLPLYHIGGFMIPCRAIITGAEVAYPGSLQYDELLETINACNPSHISIVPTMLSRLLSNSIKPGANLNYLFLGGAASENGLCKNAINHGWPVVKVYGSTETCSMVTALKTEDFSSRPGSSGKALSSNSIMIVDGKDTPLAAGISGQIAIRAKSNMQGYLKSDYELRSGWYYTGDYGWQDEEGYLFVESRKDEIIITGGENVSALEIEFALNSLSGIEDAFVFAEKDSAWGEIICAAIVSNGISEVEIRNYLKQKLAGYKVPKKIYFVDFIPRTEMQKIKKDELLKSLKLD